MKGRKTWKNAAALMILALSVCAAAICGYKLWETQQAYNIGDERYSELADLALSGRPPGGSEQGNPDISVDFDVLRAVNPDAAAWLYCPGTVIDYPVMRSADYDYYLRHLPDGTYNVNGSLFIDYNNAPDFADKLTVIYGHHMKSGKMFGSLKGYKAQAYFDEHPHMYLYTENGNYRVDLMYGCVIGAGEWRERAFMFEANLDALLTYAADNTTFISDAQYARGDRIIAMSTCSYEFDGARYVVIGVLRSDYGKERFNHG